MVWPLNTIKNPLPPSPSLFLYIIKFQIYLFFYTFFSVLSPLFFDLFSVELPFVTSQTVPSFSLQRDESLRSHSPHFLRFLKFKWSCTWLLRLLNYIHKIAHKLIQEEKNPTLDMHLPILFYPYQMKLWYIYIFLFFIFLNKNIKFY